MLWAKMSIWLPFKIVGNSLEGCGGTITSVMEHPGIIRKSGWTSMASEEAGVTIFTSLNDHHGAAVGRVGA